MSSHPACFTHNQASVRRSNGEYEAHSHGHAQVLAGLPQSAGAAMGK